MRKLLALLVCGFLPLTLLSQTKSDFFKTSDGIRIHYVEAGSGPAIVLIPGWTAPWWIWQKQVDEFSKKYHVVAVDPRSQGESDKPNYGHLPESRARDYKELIDHLELKRPVLVGWSMACGELVKYAEQFGSENVKAYVLIDGFITDKFSPEMFSALSGYMNQLQQDRRKQAEGFMRSIFKKPVSEDYLNRLIDASVQVPADTAAILIYNMLAISDFSSGLARMNQPVLFAYQPDSQGTADYLRAKLGDKVRFEKFEGDGHALFVDDPEKFNRALEAFIQSSRE